ncbi:MAG: AAA family ATPase [Chitinophagales bacterium]|nr:AAA family ATPase [Chitinophagales bacterium]
MRIIGITGTLGAGKGTIVEYLQNQHGFLHFSVRDFLSAEIVKRKLPLNRDSMVEVANELRAKYSPSYIVEQLYELAKKSGKNSIIESIRTMGEVKALRQLHGFRLLAVDAAPELRYQRISERKSATDSVSFETFMDNERREMVSTDETKQNLSACIAAADFKLMNDGTFEELYAQIEDGLKQVYK